MFERCLICTDFTDGLHRLVDFIPNLLAGGFTHITFFHSVPYSEEGNRPREDTKKLEEARSRLAPALNNIPDGVEIAVEVVSGRPLDTIPRIATERGIEVVIIGTPSRSLLDEKVFGSTSKGLARAISTPLLIYRPQLITTYTEEELALRCNHLLRCLLVPYNDSPTARYTIEQLKRYVSDQPTCATQSCMLCWVVDDSSHPAIPLEPRLQEAVEKLQPVKAELEALGLEVHVEVRTGNPLTAILDAALVHDISAIAIGDEDRGVFLNWTVPSVAQDVMRSSWFPVLLFEEGKR
ncbi:universal stress protein UspA [Rubidibacter lacunae KORDI 51-2]|uniref:Universal stress protein UspA n=1 Tax=Rubidibacter lacunae KORDI 51-2 TaxID=582515 RepID=U5DFA4_9CHRO|nr:universal stress protein [Rubidibacter lacunae]ERN40286.1 universal stress protein UspA [Rubidibacter lacunae KORDI 51-2]